MIPKGLATDGFAKNEIIIPQKKVEAMEKIVDDEGAESDWSEQFREANEKSGFN